MYLYHISNSSNLYCSSNPRFFTSCTACQAAGSSGCGWCLSSSSCQTKSNCEGEWVSRNDVCLHDKLYTWIILIVILIIVLLIILLIFLIYFALDSCIRHMADQDRRRRRHKAASRQYRNQLSSESEDSSYCNSDDSYIYGKNLSLATAAGTNTVTKSTTIKSLQYAKVNKARKNLCEGRGNQNAPDAPTQRGDLETAQRNRLECSDLSKDLSKDLTLEEILSLETDKEFWRNFPTSPEGSANLSERGTVPIYNVNRSTRVEMPGQIVQSSSIYTGEGQFYFILQLNTHI